MTTLPNVENLKKQAKGLHKQLQAGDGDSVARVRKGLPRLSQVAEADVPAAGVTLQEVQHVIAVEQGFSSWKEVLGPSGTRRRQLVAGAYGYRDWAALEAEIERAPSVRAFQDLSRLDEEEIRQLVFRSGRDRLALVLCGAGEELLGHFRANMAAQDWTPLAEAIEAHASKQNGLVEIERMKLLQWFFGGSIL